jgi:aspartyl-tRNA(Asn)/glutamyl-tRNA(Gln) amidotransferase subunit A
MQMDNWRWMSAADLGRGIAAGEIDPVDLTEVFLTAIDEHPLRDRIYSAVTHDRARAEAKAAQTRARAKQRVGPLDGVPISWKDLFDTAGTATEAGTALMKGRVPVQDAQLLKNATAAGLVCLGKTHLSEIAFSGLGLNPITETPPCVNDDEAVPGGSSSGAAASVAFGLAAIGIGSDTGGSVRIPSAWNDLTGLKTSHARLTLDGVVGLCEFFDTAGPLCRTVEDNALALAALEGSKPADLGGVGLNGVSFAVLDTIVQDGLADAPRAAFQSAVERLQAAGATIHHIEVPELVEAFSYAGPLYTGDSWSLWSNMIEAAPDKMYVRIYERIKVGADVSASEFLSAWRRLKEIREIYRERTAQFDAVIMPSSPVMPPKVQKLLDETQYYVEQNLLALRNTRVGNLMDSTSLTLPTGVPSCGIMLNGQNMGEEQLLRIGAAAEKALS